MADTVGRWVIVSANPADLVIQDGPLGWRGPIGTGTRWVPLDGAGRTWGSNLGETSIAPDGHEEARPGNGRPLMLENDALAAGYSWPPPPVVDNDGDGYTSDVDPDDYDPSNPVPQG